MAIMTLVILGLPTLALGASSLLGSMTFSDPTESLCMVWTVVEQPIYIHTCFESSTLATIDGYTTTVPSPTCIDTIVTSSHTINLSTQVPNTVIDRTTDIYTSLFASGPSSSTISRSKSSSISSSSSSIVLPPASSRAGSSSPSPIPSPSQRRSSSSSPTSTAPASPTSTLPSISTNGTCGAAVDQTCQSSGFGNCCGSNNTCGHNADHCGNGCQPGFGYCTLISNDGTCGNGVTCLGSGFGDCCSEYFFCGTGPAFCGTGCQSNLGKCTPP